MSTKTPPIPKPLLSSNQLECCRNKWNCDKSSTSTILVSKTTARIKRLTKPGMGFFSFETAWQTLQGFEIMNIIRKGQVQGVEKGDVRGQVAKLFGVAV